MNRREMLTAGLRQLARALPGLATTKSLGALLTGGAPVAPHQETLSFPSKVQEPAAAAPKPIVKED